MFSQPDRCFAFRSAAVAETPCGEAHNSTVNTGGRRLPRVTRLLTTLAVVVASFAAHAKSWAASVDWDNEAGNSEWNFGQNWSTNGVPSFPDDAVFVNSLVGPANITADIPVVRDVRFGDDATGARPGSGTINHSAGTAQLNGWFRMGLSSGSAGTYNLSGTGNLNLNGRAFIGEQAGTTATFVQDGGQFTFAALGGNEGLHVGETGNGTYTLRGGTLRQADVADGENADSWNRVGQAAGGSGTFNMSGGTASFDSRTLVGVSGSATVNQTGGLFEVRRHQIVISDLTPNAVYNISGGIMQTLQAGRSITVGQWDNSNAQLNVSGTAQVITAEDLELGAGRAVAPSSGTVTQTGGTVIVAQNLTLGVSSNAVEASISGTGIYNLQGGVLDLTTGSILRAGTPESAFNMTGGRLTDAADMQLPLDQRGGVLAPSSLAAPGTTTITGDYTLAAAGTLELSLFSTTAFDYDVLNVNGIVSLAGNLDLIASPTLPVGTLFSIINNDGNLDPVVGAFAGKPDDSIFGEDGLFYRIDYQGGDGNDVSLLLVVPEPTTLACLLTALGAFALDRRRRPM